MINFFIKIINNKINEITKWNNFAKDNNLIITIVSDFHNFDNIHPVIGLLNQDINLDTINLINIITKLIYYFEIGIIEYIVEHPKELMQSTDLTRARFAFFFEHGIAMDADKIKRLFYGNKQFEEIYKITKEEILSLYLPVQITKAGEACKH